ncbi:MAG TPA: beta-propeller fold lactonase family protein [Terracidiphilus sp.]|nr:beta-propeller fold lactonase family protein [Terracidiphilus sp.]
MMRAFRSLLLFCLAIALSAPLLARTGVTAVLPNGRRIRPAGNWIPLAPYPFALAVRPDGAQVAVPSIGFPFALNVIDYPSSAEPIVHRMPAGEKNDPAIEVHAGLAYSPNGNLLYVATGDSGHIRAYRTRNWQTAGDVSLDGPTAGKNYSGSFAETLVVSADGKTLYALDQGNWRIVILDAATLTRLASVPTGNYPFGLALSPDGSRLYVTNTGLFEYSTIPGASDADPLGTGLHFPPFGYPSRAAREGTVAEGKKIPGLGPENSLRGSSLWTYDIRDRMHPAVLARLHLGARISAVPGQTVGGSAPTGVAAAADAVYVALAHDDQVAKVSPNGAHLLGEADLSPFSGARFQDAKGRPLRGVMPSGIAVHRGRVYVAESGIDAVGVLDAATLQVLEHIPVGWNPTALGFSPDGEILYVANTKGKGAGPNAGKGHDPQMPSYIGSLELGSLSAIRLVGLPSASDLTQTVLANNMAAIANQPPLPRLKHCFLVIRENRTYDEILGDVAGANGDPTLARYGMDGWAQEDPAATHLRVTPNIHALVARYAMSDNYYVDSDVSADGHRWVVGINPTPFFNTAWTSGYGGRRTESATAAQPGRRALFGGADAPMPEDEPQFGSLWEHLVAAGKGVLNYGEGLEIEGNAEIPGSEPEGQRLFLNAPLPLPVFESTDRKFPTFNLGIPDQFRATEFERNFRHRLAAGTVPALVVIRLPDDHTADPRPEDGYPYRASYVADNDLALGRIIAFLSTTPIWKDSAMFVTEDDAQGGVDHVDAHRSVLLVASPWVRPGAVSHDHTSMGSITRTIDELLGLGPLNLEDALAAEITGIFGSQPHTQPFAALPSDTRVFDPAKARFARPKTAAAAAALRDVDDPIVIRKEMEKSRGKLRKPKSKN